MGLLFDFTLSDQDRMIDYLNASYNEQELYSILRNLDIDKNSVYVKYQTKKENCERIVEVITEQGKSEKLLLLLQTPRFFRERLLEAFSHLGVRKPLQEQSFQRLAKTVEKNIEGHSSGNLVESCKERLVLVLGKDSPQEYMDKLTGIASVVNEKGYDTVLIKKQPEISILTNEEKMLAYAAISRFVIIEKSEPAGQIDEAKICAINRFPAIWLQKEGQGDTWMQGDYEVDYKNIKVFQYNEHNLESIINEALSWVESYLEERSDALNKLYPWR